MTQRPRATGTQIENNDRVVITEWRFAPGAETGWHVHSMDYVVVYRTAASHLVESKEGTKAVSLVEGQSYFRAAGVEHNVINAGTNEIVLVETEIKAQAAVARPRTA